MWYCIMKALYTASTWAPLFKASVHLSKTFINCETVDLPSKKPNFLSDKAFVFLRNSSKVSLINDCIIL